MMRPGEALAVEIAYQASGEALSEVESTQGLCGIGRVGEGG
jgi:hypothetical protein